MQWAQSLLLSLFLEQLLRVGTTEMPVGISLRKLKIYVACRMS